MGIKTALKEIKEWFKEYETDTIPIADFDIKYKGTLVTHLHLGDNGKVTAWCGNMDEDDNAEELVLSDNELAAILAETLDCL